MRNKNSASFKKPFQETKPKLMPCFDNTFFILFTHQLT